MGTVSVVIDSDDVDDPIQELQKRLARMGFSVGDFESLTVEFDVEPENVVKTGFSFSQAESHLDQGNTESAKTEAVEADSHVEEETESNRHVSDSGSMTVDRVGNGDGKIDSVTEVEEVHDRVYEDVDDTPINQDDPQPESNPTKSECSTDEKAETPEAPELTDEEDPLHEPEMEVTDRPSLDEIENELTDTQTVPFDWAKNPEKPYRKILEVLWVAEKRLTPSEIEERTGDPSSSSMKRLWMNHYVDRYDHEEGRSWYDYRIAQRGKAVLRQARKDEGKPPLP